MLIFIVNVNHPLILVVFIAFGSFINSGCGINQISSPITDYFNGKASPIQPSLGHSIQPTYVRPSSDLFSRVTPLFRSVQKGKLKNYLINRKASQIQPSFGYPIQPTSIRSSSDSFSFVTPALFPVVQYGQPINYLVNRLGTTTRKSYGIQYSTIPSSVLNNHYKRPSFQPIIPSFKSAGALNHFDHFGNLSHQPSIARSVTVENSSNDQKYPPEPSAIFGFIKLRQKKESLLIPITRPRATPLTKPSLLSYSATIEPKILASSKNAVILPLDNKSIFKRVYGRVEVKSPSRANYYFPSQLLNDSRIPNLEPSLVSPTLSPLLIGSPPLISSLLMSQSSNNTPVIGNTTLPFPGSDINQTSVMTPSTALLNQSTMSVSSQQLTNFLDPAQPIHNLLVFMNNNNNTGGIHLNQQLSGLLLSNESRTNQCRSKNKFTTIRSNGANSNGSRTKVIFKKKLFNQDKDKENIGGRVPLDSSICEENDALSSLDFSGSNNDKSLIDVFKMIVVFCFVVGVISVVQNLFIFKMLLATLFLTSRNTNTNTTCTSGCDLFNGKSASLTYSTDLSTTTSLSTAKPVIITTSTTLLPIALQPLEVINNAPSQTLSITPTSDLYEFVS